MNVSKLNFADVDCYIATSEHTRYYFTGFHSSFGIMVATPSKTFYLTDNRYGEASKAYFGETDVELILITPGANSTDVVKGILSSCNAKKVGFEDNMSVREFNQMKLAYGDIEFIAKGEYFEELRSVKTEEELEKITKAMDITSEAFNCAVTEFRCGMTEQELCAILNYHLFSKGANSLAFETIVASGENGARPHAVPTMKKVEKGELVTFDFGARYDGYCADMTRTIAFGKISPELEKLYDTVLEAQLLGLNSVKTGMTGCEVDGIVREFFKSRGMAEYFCHSLGHAVGTEIHEDPRLSPTCTTVLKENMVVTVEPGLYISGLGGVRIEDTIILKDGGNINMAHCEKKLITINK